MHVPKQLKSVANAALTAKEIAVLELVVKEIAITTAAAGTWAMSRLRRS
jgi:hypothetical protein